MAMILYNDPKIFTNEIEKTRSPPCMKSLGLRGHFGLVPQGKLTTMSYDQRSYDRDGKLRWICIGFTKITAKPWSKVLLIPPSLSSVNTIYTWPSWNVFRTARSETSTISHPHSLTSRFQVILPKSAPSSRARYVWEDQDKILTFF